MRSWLLCAATLALSGCQYLPGTDAAKIEKAKTEVASGLRDPASAQFRELKVHGDYVCGEVNGKNAFGGYTGFTRFVSGLSETTLEPQGDDEDSVVARRYFEVIWMASCAAPA